MKKWQIVSNFIIATAITIYNVLYYILYDFEISSLLIILAIIIAYNYQFCVSIRYYKSGYKNSYKNKLLYLSVYFVHNIALFLIMVITIIKRSAESVVYILISSILYISYEIYLCRSIAKEGKDENAN